MPSWRSRSWLSPPFPRCLPPVVCRCLFPVQPQPRRVFASEALLSRGGVYNGQADGQRIRQVGSAFKVHNLPPLVILALGVCLQVVFTLKPFRALDTVVLSKTRKVLCILGGLVLCQMARRVDVCADLVVVPTVRQLLIWIAQILQLVEHTWCDA